VICTTDNVPSKDGRSLYSLCPVGRSGRAGAGEVYPGKIYDAYPAFAIIRDHYEKEGLKVGIQTNYSSGGESDWVELIVVL